MIDLKPLIQQWHREANEYANGSLLGGTVGDMNRASASAIRRLLGELEALLAAQPPSSPLEERRLALSEECRNNLAEALGRLQAELAHIRQERDDWAKYAMTREQERDAAFQRIDALREEADKLEQAGQELAKEYHALLGEEMYAGTRKDWIWRAQHAEQERDRLRTTLSEIRAYADAKGYTAITNTAGRALLSDTPMNGPYPETGKIW